MIPYGRQDVTDEDIARVADVLQSDYLTTGPVTQDFEKAFAEYIGAKHAVVVCNATAALHLAMVVAGIGSGDRVVTSPNTFLASANCAAFVGATPDFADIDPVTYNLCPNSLAENWQPDTKAVIPVHYAGGPADMEAISGVARTRGAVVIEDACHAVGGAIEQNGAMAKIGGHSWADMTTFSFHPVKTMTTGEGGMLVTDNDEYAHQARLLRSHSMVRNTDQTVGLELDDDDERGPWYYEMQQLGYNYRITDFQCALGLSQLSRLDSALTRRREIVGIYNQAFADCPYLTTPRLRNQKEQEFTSWHLYTLLFDFEGIGKTRSELILELRNLGVGTQVLYIPIYLQPWYRENYGFAAGKCPRAEAYYQQTLSLPLFPSMSSQDVGHVIDSVLRVVDSKTATT